jgi:hypothetical protein
VFDIPDKKGGKVKEIDDNVIHISFGKEETTH